MFRTKESLAYVPKVLFLIRHYKAKDDIKVFFFQRLHSKNYKLQSTKSFRTYTLYVHNNITLISLQLICIISWNGVLPFEDRYQEDIP